MHRFDLLLFWIIDLRECYWVFSGLLTVESRCTHGIACLPVLARWRAVDVQGALCGSHSCTGEIVTLDLGLEQGSPGSGRKKWGVFQFK